MYSVDKLDRVVPLDTIPKPEVGAPSPVLRADEREACVSYFTRGATDDINDDPFVSVTFRGYEALMFGQPSDDSLHLHPLYERGLNYYGAFEVEQSSWVRARERMNVYPTSVGSARLRHFVLTFHDSMFECAAHGFEVTLKTPAA